MKTMGYKSVEKWMYGEFENVRSVYNNIRQSGGYNWCV